MILNDNKKTNQLFETVYLYNYQYIYWGNIHDAASKRLYDAQIKKDGIIRLKYFFHQRVC